MASDNKVASLKNKRNLYTTLPAIALLSRHKMIDSQSVFKVKADGSKKRHIVVLGWE